MMTQQAKYLAPRLTPDNLDLYLVRSSILRALKETLPYFSGTLLDVGCGHMPYKSLFLTPPSQVDTYIGLDIGGDIYSPPDIEWDGEVMPFPANSIDCAIATEVLEHCPEPGIILAETFRVLRPGGLFFITVPFLWPLHDVPYDEYRYTPFALRRLLKKAGFGHIELEAFGGWDSSLAQMIGLWVRRRPMNRFMRLTLSHLLLPLFVLLQRKSSPLTDFREGTMITGLGLTVRKPGASLSI